jgi:hypothetical protein
MSCRSGLFIAVFELLLIGCAGEPEGVAPICDSRMSLPDAYDGLSSNCPAQVRDRQQLITVEYYSFDGKLHCGQLVIDSELVDDIQAIFKIARDERFPIHAVIPISHPQFRKEDAWSDELSMAANNTSAFNYRRIAEDRALSLHALGRAIDINPMQNPYIEGDRILPLGGRYDISAPGTLTSDSPIVQAFLDRNWKWGGNWESTKDYQHFEKPLEQSSGF